MQEFSSVTASSYDAESLAPMLTEKAGEGWSVVSIVSAGTNVVAYLSRDGDGATSTTNDAPEQTSDITSDEGRTPDEDHITEIEVIQEAAQADEAGYSPSLPGTDPSATFDAESSDDATSEPSGWGTADDRSTDTSTDIPTDTPSEHDFSGGSDTPDTPTLPGDSAVGGNAPTDEADGDTTTTYVIGSDSGTDTTTEAVDSSGSAEHAGAPLDDGSDQRSTGDTTSGDEAGGAGEADASGVPAGWYADPSGRFELRYWDGNAWTEHVSRAGQQYTDPPVA